MTTHDATAVAEFLLGNLEQELQLTDAVFKAVPADRLDYRPDPKSRSAIGLVRHIAVEDPWFLNAVADGGAAGVADDTETCGIETPAQAAERYQRTMSEGIARVRALSGEQLTRDVTLFGAYTMPGLQWLSLVLRHSAHHRGQLSAYLRAMGGKVPPIYGPSADTQAQAAV